MPYVGLCCVQMVYQLYQGQDEGSRSIADCWLQSLQSSEQAWTLCWVLLQHQVIHISDISPLTSNNDRNTFISWQCVLCGVCTFCWYSIYSSEVSCTDEVVCSSELFTDCVFVVCLQEVAVQNFGALMLHNKISKSW